MVWTRHLCRICGQIGDACYPIFEASSGRNIELKMKKCFSFLVFTDDYKPKEICNCCYMKLNQLYEFVEMCYLSNDKFETMMYASNQGLWLDKQTQNYDDCQLNGVIVNSKANVQTHLDTSSVVMVVDYESSLHLDQTATEPVCLSATYNNEIAIRNIEENKEKDLVNFKTYQCYEQNHTVLRHSSDFYKTLPASHASSTFIHLSEDVAHYGGSVNSQYDKLIEKEPPPLTEALIKDQALHITGVDTLDPINCQEEECKKVSAKKKSFSCEHCNKTFTKKVSLTTHISIHTKIRPYICDLCNKSFAVERDLRCHKRIHTNTYQCKYCAKNFIVPSKLERHLRIHTNTKPFVCPIEHCGKSFSDKCNLEGHKQSHSSQKKYTCDTCNKSFKTSSQLRDHKKAHSDNTPYKCRYCGKMYKWKTNLNVHVKKHEGYKCVHCNKDCEKLSQLFKHRKFCKSAL